jgi:hypothetical protein
MNFLYLNILFIAVGSKIYIILKQKCLMRDSETTVNSIVHGC